MSDGETTKVYRSFLLFLSVILLAAAGCVRQEISIVLRKDGSGTYHVRRTLGEEEAMLLEGGELLAEEVRTGTAEEENTFTHLTRTRKVCDSEDEPGSKIEDTIYTFKELGKALPELDNEVIMGPRFTVRDGRFVVFLNREKQEFDGMRSDDDKGKGFYKLTVEFPAPPASKNGTVKGNTVTWSFDGPQLENLRKIPIGTPILEAGISASAVTVDLTPRIVPEKKKNVFGGRNEKKEIVEHFQATIPILSDSPRKSDELNADLRVFMPLGDAAVPFSYGNLSLSRLSVDGKPVKATLISDTSGVFDGRDEWGNRTPGLPVHLEFHLDDPWVRTIDLIEAKLDIAVPKKTRDEAAEIRSSDRPFPVLEMKDAPAGKIAVIKIDPGSSGATFPAPSIEVLSDIAPAGILTVYLDTTYGLRYRPSGIRWERKETKELYDRELKETAKKVFGEKVSFYSGSFSYRTVPPPPFKLVFAVITESSPVSRTLKLENIDVSGR